MEIAPQIFVPNTEAGPSHQTQSESQSNMQDNTTNELWCNDGYDNLISMIEDDYICENQGKIIFIKRV